MTFDITINILITAFLGYVTLNSIFRYHFSIDRIFLFGTGLVFLGCLWYRDTNRIIESIIALGLIIVFTLILKFISVKKKRHGYFFFNTYKSDYSNTKSDLYKLANEFDISTENIQYNACKPWLVIFTNTSHKSTNSLMKKMDKIYTHQPIRFTMYNYWFLIIFIVLLVITWRF